VRNAYLGSQRVLGGLICLLGIAMLVSTLVRGGGPLALGVVIGACFAALGAARVWLGRPREGARRPR
jgi:hypothetical protein